YSDAGCIAATAGQIEWSVGERVGEAARASVQVYPATAAKVAKHQIELAVTVQVAHCHAHGSGDAARQVDRSGEATCPGVHIHLAESSIIAEHDVKRAVAVQVTHGHAECKGATVAQIEWGGGEWVGEATLAVVQVHLAAGAKVAEHDIELAIAVQ